MPCHESRSLHLSRCFDSRRDPVDIAAAERGHQTRGIALRLQAADSAQMTVYRHVPGEAHATVDLQRALADQRAGCRRGEKRRVAFKRARRFTEAARDRMAHAFKAELMAGQRMT